MRCVKLAWTTSARPPMLLGAHAHAAEFSAHFSDSGNQAWGGRNRSVFSGQRHARTRPGRNAHTLAFKLTGQSGLARLSAYPPLARCMGRRIMVFFCSIWRPPPGLRPARRTAEPPARSPRGRHRPGSAGRRGRPPTHRSPRPVEYRLRQHSHRQLPGRRDTRQICRDDVGIRPSLDCTRSGRARVIYAQPPGRPLRSRELHHHHTACRPAARAWYRSDPVHASALASALALHYLASAGRRLRCRGADRCPASRYLHLFGTKSRLGIDGLCAASWRMRTSERRCTVLWRSDASADRRE
jgi:hypothetical protein